MFIINYLWEPWRWVSGVVYTCHRGSDFCVCDSNLEVKMMLFSVLSVQFDTRKAHFLAFQPVVDGATS